MICRLLLLGVVVFVFTFVIAVEFLLRQHL